MDQKTIQKISLMKEIKTKQDALNSIKELEQFIQELDSIKNKNKEQDDWFLSILRDLKIGRIESNIIEYQNSKGELMIMDRKNGEFWLSNNRIWIVLESKYSMEYIDIQSYTKNMLLAHLNWKVTTTSDFHQKNH